MSYRNNTYEHVFIIPTNRPLEATVEGYIPEIRFMEKYLGQKVPFVIIEESLPKIEKSNRELLDSLRESNPDVLLVHFDSACQREFFNYMRARGIKRDILDLLDFKGLSYGRAMNKQFLTAAAFGAEYIHRRDSDTKPMGDNFFPSQMELKFLGKRVSEVGSLVQSKDVEFDPDKVINLVGSGYSGGSDWKIDFSLLLPDDSDLILEINRMLGSSEDLSKQYLEEITSKNSIVTEEAKFLTDDNHPNPDCGNISFYKIHRYIPCSPVPDTLGTDYIPVNFLKATCSPIIYHNHFVYHAFTSDRKKDNRDYVFSYWPRVAKLMDYYTALRGSEFMQMKNSEGRYINMEEASGIEEISNETNQYPYREADMEKARMQDVSRLGDILMSAGNSLLKEIGAAFKDKEVQDRIIRNTNLGLENHKKLFSAWSKLIETAGDYNIV